MENQVILDTPFSPYSLAKRWDVSATTIRNQCVSGDLAHFRLGKLYRIPAAIVKETEACQNSQLEGYAAASASHGLRSESAVDINLRHAQERKPRLKEVVLDFRPVYILVKVDLGFI